VIDDHCAFAVCQDLGDGFDCDMFSRLDPAELDTDWANICNSPVAYNIVCTP
jgi:hypothetical protein